MKRIGEKEQTQTSASILQARGNKDIEVKYLHTLQQQQTSNLRPQQSP
jgi:hypothetical protein